MGGAQAPVARQDVGIGLMKYLAASSCSRQFIGDDTTLSHTGQKMGEDTQTTSCVTDAETLSWRQF